MNKHKLYYIVNKFLNKFLITKKIKFVFSLWMFYIWKEQKILRFLVKRFLFFIKSYTEKNQQLFSFFVHALVLQKELVSLFLKKMLYSKTTHFFKLIQKKNFKKQSSFAFHISTNTCVIIKHIENIYQNT